MSRKKMAPGWKPKYDTVTQAMYYVNTKSGTNITANTTITTTTNSTTIAMTGAHDRTSQPHPPTP